jgi:hypothetical protein
MTHNHHNLPVLLYECMQRFHCWSHTLTPAGLPYFFFRRTSSKRRAGSPCISLNKKQLTQFIRKIEPKNYTSAQFIEEKPAKNLSTTARATNPRHPLTHRGNPKTTDPSCIIIAKVATKATNSSDSYADNSKSHKDTSTYAQETPPQPEVIIALHCCCSL